MEEAVTTVVIGAGWSCLRFLAQGWNRNRIATPQVRLNMRDIVEDWRSMFPITVTDRMDHEAYSALIWRKFIATLLRDNRTMIVVRINE
jgi:hypothetical protein